MSLRGVNLTPNTREAFSVYFCFLLRRWLCLGGNVGVGNVDVGNGMRVFISISESFVPNDVELKRPFRRREGKLFRVRQKGVEIASFRRRIFFNAAAFAAPNFFFLLPCRVATLQTLRRRFKTTQRRLHRHRRRRQRQRRRRRPNVTEREGLVAKRAD